MSNLLHPWRTFGPFVTILALATPAVAQMPPGPPPLAQGTGVLVGQVVDAATGKGVASAIVTLAGSRRAMATADGRFAFRGLPAGSHSLTASRHGYVDGSYGVRRPGGPSLPVVLADGERRGDLVIRLWRHGAIAGTVVDEAGEPLVGIQVTALRRTLAGGRRRFVPAGSGSTDDRGVYRIGRLTPGDYAVGMASSQVSLPASAVRQYEEQMMLSPTDPGRNTLLQAIFQVGGSPSLTGSPDSRQIGDHVQSMNRSSPTPPPADGPRVMTYPSVYYPAAAAAQSASIVTVASGQERSGIDLQVRPVAMVKVSGNIIGATGSAANMPVRLIPAGVDDLGRPSDVAGTITDASGAFTFLTVPSGDYLLKVVHVPRAAPVMSAPLTVQVGAGMTISGMASPTPDIPPVPSEPTMWATMPVSVGNSDVAGVNVVLRTGVRVSGRVEFEGTMEKPPADQLARTPVVLEPVDGTLDRTATGPGRIDAKGQFTTYGAPAGRYLLRVPTAPTGWTFKGAFLGERDIADVPIELASTDVADVVLTFTDRPASIAGTVQMTERASRDGVAVIVFPVETSAWTDGGSTSRRLRRVTTTDAGLYEVKPLPAGAYYVAAVSETVAGEWQDPAFLEQLVAGAAHVQLDHGESVSQSLRIQEVRR